MPTNRRKRRRPARSSPLSSPYQTPEPDDLHHDDTVPSEVESLLPNKPCSPALENLDIVNQICLFIPSHSLTKCLYVSRTCHLASSRIFYSHVRLTRTASVLKLLKEKPGRITRQHSQKPMTPLAFLRYTSSIAIGGDIHRDDGLPNSWVKSLVEVFPNVRKVKIEPMGFCYGCRKNRRCLKDLWVLANKLAANVVCLDLENTEGPSLFEYHPFFPNFKAPSLYEMGPLNLDTLVIAVDCRRLAKDMSRFMNRHQSIFGLFSSFQIVVMRPSWAEAGDDRLKGELEGHARFRPWEKWVSDIQSVGDIAQNILSLVRTRPSAEWTFYNLADLHPKESSFWPATLAKIIPDSPLPDPPQRSVSLMVDTAHSTSTPNGTHGPKVTFKTRVDYLSERRHPFELPLDYHAELEEKERSCDRPFSGLYGTWELVSRKIELDTSDA